MSANEKVIELQQMPFKILDIDFRNARRRTRWDSQHCALYINTHVLTQVQHFDQPKTYTWLALKLNNSITSQPISRIQSSVLSMITHLCIHRYDSKYDSNVFRKINILGGTQYKHKLGSNFKIIFSTLYNNGDVHDWHEDKL